jgi:hypothetical protein
MLDRDFVRLASVPAGQARHAHRRQPVRAPELNALPAQADVLAAAKSGSPTDSGLGPMSRGASSALSERLEPRANGAECAPELTPTGMGACGCFAEAGPRAAGHGCSTIPEPRGGGSVSPRAGRGQRWGGQRGSWPCKRCSRPDASSALHLGGCIDTLKEHPRPGARRRAERWAVSGRSASGAALSGGGSPGILARTPSAASRNGGGLAGAPSDVGSLLRDRTRDLFSAIEVGPLLGRGAPPTCPYSSSRGRPGLCGLRSGGCTPSRSARCLAAVRRPGAHINGQVRLV